MPQNRPLPPPPIWQMQPSEFISDAFPRAQAAVASTSGPLMQFYQQRLNSVGSNMPGLPFGLTKDKISLMPPGALIASGKPEAADPIEMNKTAGHEAAHSVWADLPAEHRSAWFAIHKKNPLVAGLGYSNAPSHAFAEAYGSYVAEPLRLQRESPEAYNFFKNISGFEYARPGKSFGVTK